jgi:hypothetical protein
VEEVTEPQGFVKKVQIYPKAIRQDYQVVVEYELSQLYQSRDFEGAHLRYGKMYSELEEAISDISSYLGRSIENWIDYTTSPLKPEKLEINDLERVERFFSALIERGDLHLPNGSVFELFRDFGPDDDLDPTDE